MTKPREKTREELQAEIEDGKKKIRQFENREKMLRQKLSKEERRTRSHRLIVRGAVFESIVPEAKDMADEEAAALLRLALTSEPVREFLKKRAEKVLIWIEIHTDHDLLEHLREFEHFFGLVLSGNRHIRLFTLGSVAPVNGI